MDCQYQDTDFKGYVHPCTDKANFMAVNVDRPNKQAMWAEKFYLCLTHAAQVVQANPLIFISDHHDHMRSK